MGAQFKAAASALPLRVRARSVADSLDDLVAAMQAASRQPERPLPDTVPPGDTRTFRALFGKLG